MAGFDVKIIGHNGWAKSTKIEKAITRIGSALSNDIQISTPGISPNHLQLFFLQESPATCMVLNLGPNVHFRQSGDSVTEIPTYAVCEAQNGDVIFIADYQIQFEMPLSARLMQTSRVLEATLEFPNAILRPELITAGRIFIHHIGSQPTCQFQVTISGFPDRCVKMDPLPLLFPDGTGEASIYLFHRGQYPHAGFHDLTITITAPETYPGEQTVLQQRVYVAPVFEQSLELQDDLAGISPMQLNITTEPQANAPEAPAPSVMPPGEPAAPSKPWESLPASEPAALPARPVEPAPLPKIIRNSSENFWDGE